MQIQIRNYQVNDIDKYSQMYQDNNDFRRETRWVSPQAVREFLFSPRCALDKDMLVAEADGEIAGLCYLIPEPEIERAIIRGIVLPGYRQKGIGSELLELAMKRATELGVSMVHIDLDEKNQAGRELLKMNDFRKIRVFHEMEFSLDEKGFDRPSSEDIRIEPLPKGQEGLLTEVQNLCFNGSWGYHPNEESEVRYCLSLGKYSYDDVLLAFFQGRPAGFCWLTIESEAALNEGPDRGRVHMMGVVPAYRRAGLGRSLLGAGLSHLKNKRINKVELTVDSANETAFSLYHSAGFKIYSNTHWYERVL